LQISIQKSLAKQGFFVWKFASIFSGYQSPKVLPHFWGLKSKPSKGFKSTKWRSHFVLWYENELALT
jgi:hypothetical protein